MVNALIAVQKLLKVRPLAVAVIRQSFAKRAATARATNLVEGCVMSDLKELKELAAFGIEVEE